MSSKKKKREREKYIIICYLKNPWIYLHFLKCKVIMLEYVAVQSVSYVCLCIRSDSSVLHYLWEFFTSMSFESVMLSNHLILFPTVLFCLQTFPVSASFPMNWLFTSGGQSTGVSAWASVLPMNSQGWFPSELTNLISLQSKGL